MTTSETGTGQRPVEPVPGTEVEVVRWTSAAGDGECTVVWLSADRLDLAVANAEVTETERQRAGGYSRRSDRVLSLASAWLTRRLVATCLGVDPRQAPITRHCPECPRPHGRPVVGAAATGGVTVHVSATHTHGLVGVAISTSGAVGLDLENLQARGPQAWPTVWRLLGRRPPAPEGPAPEGPEAALEAATAWVRTEAVLKATGNGLAVDSRSIDIRPGAEPVVTRWPWGDPAGEVSLFDLNPAGRYVAALAALHDAPGGYPRR